MLNNLIRTRAGCLPVSRSIPEISVYDRTFLAHWNSGESYSLCERAASRAETRSDILSGDLL